MRRCGAALLFFCLLAAPGFARIAPVRDLGERLQQALQGGEIDEATQALYWLYAVKAPERLPHAWQVHVGPTKTGHRVGSASDGEAPLVLRCGTPLLRFVKARLASMPAEHREEAEGLLVRPARVLPKTVQVGDKSVDTTLPFWAVTANFSIEWGSDLTNEDGSSPPRDADADGIPDVVELWASLLEASWAGDAGVLDPDDPDSVFSGTSLTTNLVPVYMGNSDPDQGIDNIASGTYAFTQESSPTPYIVVNNDLRFVPPNDEGSFGLPKIHGAMKITASHELFHVIQFLYEPNGWQPVADDWWLEASATWMEDEVFDEVNDYYQYFEGNGWASFVEQGLPVRNTTAEFNYVTRAYGDSIFAKYLAEHVAGQASMGDVWDLIRGGRRILFDDPENNRVANGALNRYAQQRGFDGIGQLFLGFAAANAVMDYEEGAHYGDVPIRKAGNLDHSEGDAGLVPNYLGATYLRTNSGGARRVDVDGDPDTPWGLSLLVDRADGYRVALGARDPNGAPTVGVADLEDGDVLYASPSFLDPASSAKSYDTFESPFNPIDTTPPSWPSGQANLSLSATEGGFDASWDSAQDDVGVAGYVIRWGAGSATRTLMGEITSVEIRALPPALYDVSVFAYDESGNADPVTAATDQITVLLPPPQTPIPTDPIVATGTTPSGGGGGGGGGGGCFLGALVE